MLVYPAGSDQPIRVDLLVRVVYRTDLTPIPATLEIEVRHHEDTDKVIVQGARLKVGPELTEFILVKVFDREDAELLQDGRKLSSIRAVGLLASCAPIANRLQHAVIRENATMGEIYRACGANITIESDFTVPSFACYVGMTPSFEIAKILREEAGVLIYKSGKILFRRLKELKAAPYEHQSGDDVVQRLDSPFLKGHAVSAGFTSETEGEVLHSSKDAQRGSVYRPRADQRIVNNMGIALVQTTKVFSIVLPLFNAGMRIDVGGIPQVVITAAHVLDTDGSSVPGHYTQFWLGEIIG